MFSSYFTPDIPLFAHSHSLPTPDLTIPLPWYFTIRIALAICGTKLLSGSHDRCIRVWDLSDEEMTEVRKLRGHGGSVLALAVAGDRVLSGR